MGLRTLLWFLPPPGFRFGRAVREVIRNAAHALGRFGVVQRLRKRSVMLSKPAQAPSRRFHVDTILIFESFGNALCSGLHAYQWGIFPFNQWRDTRKPISAPSC